LLHTLLQQSRSLKQRSLLAWHPEAEAHLPLLQFVEQQSAPEAHDCPRTLHTVVTGAQVPPAQLPEQQLLLVAEQDPPLSVHCFVQVRLLHQNPIQQSSLVSQAPPIDEHVGAVQMAPMHRRPKQHGLLVQPWPAIPQVVRGDEQIPFLHVLLVVVGQHSASLAQKSPVPLQLGRQKPPTQVFPLQQSVLRTHVSPVKWQLIARQTGLVDVESQTPSQQSEVMAQLALGNRQLIGWHLEPALPS
jgi:hypothetical protein